MTVIASYGLTRPCGRTSKAFCRSCENSFTNSTCGPTQCSVEPPSKICLQPNTLFNSLTMEAPSGFNCCRNATGDVYNGLMPRFFTFTIEMSDASHSHPCCGASASGTFVLEWDEFTNSYISPFPVDPATDGGVSPSQVESCDCEDHGAICRSFNYWQLRCGSGAWVLWGWVMDCDYSDPISPCGDHVQFEYVESVGDGYVDPEHDCFYPGGRLMELTSGLSFCDSMPVNITMLPVLPPEDE